MEDIKELKKLQKEYNAFYTETTKKEIEQHEENNFNYNRLLYKHFNN